MTTEYSRSPVEQSGSPSAQEAPEQVHSEVQEQFAYRGRFRSLTISSKGYSTAKAVHSNSPWVHSTPQPSPFDVIELVRAKHKAKQQELQEAAEKEEAANREKGWGFVRNQKHLLRDAKLTDQVEISDDRNEATASGSHREVASSGARAPSSPYKQAHVPPELGEGEDSRAKLRPDGRLVKSTVPLPSAPHEAITNDGSSFDGPESTFNSHSLSKTNIAHYGFRSAPHYPQLPKSHVAACATSQSQSGSQLRIGDLRVTSTPTSTEYRGQSGGDQHGDQTRKRTNKVNGDGIVATSSILSRPQGRPTPTRRGGGGGREGGGVLGAMQQQQHTRKPERGIDVPQNIAMAVQLASIPDLMARKLLPWQSVSCPRAVESIRNARLAIVHQVCIYIAILIITIIVTTSTIMHHPPPS